MGVFLLYLDDIFAVQFEMDSVLRLPVAVQTTLGSRFPFLNAPLLSINDKPCPSTIEALQIELLCSGAWPVRLLFGNPIAAVHKNTMPRATTTTTDGEYSNFRDGLVDGKRGNYRDGLADGEHSNFRDGLADGEQSNFRDGLADGKMDESEEEEEPADNEPIVVLWSFAALEEKSCTIEELSAMEAGGSVPPNVMGPLMRFVLLKGHSESHLSAVWTVQSQPELYAILGKRKQANTAFVILPYQLQNSSRWAMAWLCLLRGSVLVVFNLGGGELDENFLLLLNKLSHRKYDTVSLPHYLPPAATQRDEDTGFVILELTARLVKYRQFKNLDTAKQVFALEQQRVSALDQDAANQLREKVCNALRLKNNLDMQMGQENAGLPSCPDCFLWIQPHIATCGLCLSCVGNYHLL
ncbi:hypothetical protein BASA81_009829 [Batrachochytrium salamandrivorans]|nr:hypothetical protein BASA81_009829 [Batrachochytrium salamandrivorans]